MTPTTPAPSQVASSGQPSLIAKSGGETTEGAQATNEISQAPSPDQTLIQREAAIAAKELELARREAELAKEQQTASVEADDGSSLFGLPLPSLGSGVDELESDKPSQQTIVERSDDGEIDAIESAVTSHSVTPTGQAVVVLANGSVWRQTDSKKSRFPKSGNIFVRIQRASFGSYFMYINNEGSAIRVRRVDRSQRG
jgi:hypothetical protein